MKDNVRGHDNIVFFPKLKWRLKTEVLDAIEKKNFTYALDLIQEMVGLFGEIEDKEITIGKVICLLEVGQLEYAKKECKYLLKAGIGDYFDILQIYVSILVQLNQYQEVVNTLEALLEEDRVPADRAEHIFQILDFSRKMLDQEGSGNKSQLPRIEKEKLDLLVINKHPMEHLMLLREIASIPIEDAVPYLKKALKNQAIHPFVKTMMLQLLLEAGVSEEVEIEKFGKTKVVIPSQLTNVLELPFHLSVLNALDDELGSENPTLFELGKQFWEQYLFIIYPFQPRKDHRKWAAALHLTGYELHGIEISVEEVCQRYMVKEAEVLTVQRELSQKESLFLTEG